jgi:RNA polymerase sigma-70 factor (ECF subfamily)
MVMQIAAQTTIANDAASDSLDRLEESIQVLRAKEGDAGAFTWLMARHERPVLYYIRRLIAQPEDALDVHQDVWLAVFRGLPGLRKPGAFRGWLYRLAHDRAARFIKEEIRDAKSKESIESVAEAAPGLAEEDPERVHRALGALSPSQREVLTLHYLRDLSLEEIAVACDAPLGTVKSRLHYARLALRRHLERNEDE